MALSKDDMKNQFPLPAYNYRVSIDGETVAFSQATGLSIGYENATVYKESQTEEKPGPVVMRMPGQASDVTLTLQKGLVKGKSMAALYKWISSKQLHLIQKKDIQIDLCDEEGKAVFRWNVINAYPTKLDAPSFEATSNDAAIESMELSADSVTMEEV